MWYIYTMEYYSAIKKKECIWISSNEVGEPRAYYTQCSKSERERQILYINTYTWNLEGWYWWTYLQGRNGDTTLFWWKLSLSSSIAPKLIFMKTITHYFLYSLFHGLTYILIELHNYKIAQLAQTGLETSSTNWL